MQVEVKEDMPTFRRNICHLVNIELDSCIHRQIWILRRMKRNFKKYLNMHRQIWIVCRMKRNFKKIFKYYLSNWIGYHG